MFRRRATLEREFSLSGCLLQNFSKARSTTRVACARLDAFPHEIGNRLLLDNVEPGDIRQGSIAVPLDPP
jgi:hypothetical protein